MPKQKQVTGTDSELSKLIEKDMENSIQVSQEQIEAEPWLEEENYDGQLSVDVFQNNNSIVVKSAIAGVKAEDIDINLNNDTITIKGIRRDTGEVDEDDYFYKECYWGGFSRSIILPIDIKHDKVDAQLENGILTVTLPISEKSKARNIEVKEIGEKATAKKNAIQTKKSKK